MAAISSVEKYKQPKVAFVSGANGISGSAIVEHLIRQPASEWSKIIVTSRRPLPNYWADARIEFVAVDFLEPIMDNIQKLTPVCADVTHTFYTSYVHSNDLKSLPAKNVPLFQNFLDVIDTVAPRLQRYYGPHLGFLKAPAEESHLRYEDNGDNFYYNQEDYLRDVQAKRNTWTWNVIRPTGIIGFTPLPNGMSEAFNLAVYFLLCRELDQPPFFPGNPFMWSGVSQKSYSPSIADLAVYVSTNDHCANEAFNHANGEVIVWKTFWPKLAGYWGMECPEPKFENVKRDPHGLLLEFDLVEWAKDKKEVWDRVVDKYGGKKEAFEWTDWRYLNWTVGREWTTHVSLEKAREFGWTRFDGNYASFVATFTVLEQTGVLPKHA
ncbi:nucleoside-diphosphate-sugar epimerase GsfE [Talaromyces proteolyticus]|uniref:Nucleoside-diphosphate-sugar epimerase GsfE n=1 Tax=Talaromyces proteolyticus TaxID=1131652 RepID=A0AAD4KRD3_9EURO|nr:nucleoside-diphosphate-sugar epimerase GsfE [Talaromyces proteolyticus]KAH8698734.1 nucleoside-diphosphate-sugar epimerase GsfE [Talaromyces proteolyticus]